MNKQIKGEIEELIVKELALNPNRLIKPLSVTLKRDYRSIYNALRSLKRKGFIKKGEMIDTKGGSFSSFKLTQRGIAQVLTDVTIDQLKIMKNYEGDYVPLLSEYNRLNKTINNPELMKKTLRGVGKLHLAYGENPNTEKMFGVATTASILLDGMTGKEKKELLSAIHQDKKLSKALKLVVKELGL